MTIVAELRGLITADLAVSDACVLAGAARLIEDLDKRVTELRQELAQLGVWAPRTCTSDFPLRPQREKS